MFPSHDRSRRYGFFFRTRKLILSKYESLFRQEEQDTEERERNVDEEDIRDFDQHWGWFATIYQLSKTNILSITGKTSITELNFPFVLNYLAIEKDYNIKVDRQLKRQEQEIRNRVKIR